MKYVEYAGMQCAYKNGYIYSKNGYIQKVEQCPICRKLFDTQIELWEHMHTEHIARKWHNIEVFQP